MGVLKMGTVALDGTKIHANASRHSALSYEHAGKIEEQLQAEVADLMAKAEAADTANVPDGMSIPDELARREERLRKIAEARAKIEARARERYAREQAEHEAKLAARATIGASRACTGCSTSSSKTICRAIARAMEPKTWPWCGRFSLNLIRANKAKGSIKTNPTSPTRLDFCDFRLGFGG
jgi:hypothetical protein